MRRESGEAVMLGRNERWTRTGCHETGSFARNQEAEVGTICIDSRHASRTEDKTSKL